MRSRTRTQEQMSEQGCCRTRLAAQLGTVLTLAVCSGVPRVVPMAGLKLAQPRAEGSHVPCIYHHEIVRRQVQPTPNARTPSLLHRLAHANTPWTFMPFEPAT